MSFMTRLDRTSAIDLKRFLSSPVKEELSSLMTPIEPETAIAVPTRQGTDHY